ncbi:hypothetical protein CISIN_1g024357mg [Citrus sinensis]|nr:hypothetical protein CISIN_1g024357mg [Citrus sinensis]
MHTVALVALSGSRFLARPSPTLFLHTNANAKSRNYSSRPFCRCCLRRKQNRQSLSKTWPSISLALFSAGFFLGPAIDGLHSRVNLVVYENGSINVGPLHTNIWVPPLLGLFYCTVGLLQLFLDDTDSDRASSESEVPDDGSLQKTVFALM